VFDFAEVGLHGLIQMAQVFGHEVGQPSVLQVTPDELHRIRAAAHRRAAVPGAAEGSGPAVHGSRGPCGCYRRPKGRLAGRASARALRAEKRRSFERRCSAGRRRESTARGAAVLAPRSRPPRPRPYRGGGRTCVAGAFYLSEPRWVAPAGLKRSRFRRSARGGRPRLGLFLNARPVFGQPARHGRVVPFLGARLGLLCAE
jgi:hypothetical protein